MLALGPLSAPGNLKIPAVWECHLEFFRPSPSGPIFPELAENDVPTALAAGSPHNRLFAAAFTNIAPIQSEHRLCRISAVRDGAY